MIVQIVLLIVGFVLLIYGADWLVSGASSLAKKYNVSDLAIGLTIVAFGTSAPELIVNIFASSQSHFDIVFGNVIGSNNFNLFIILGIAGLITPLTVQSSTVWKEIPISLLAVMLLFALTNFGVFDDVCILSRIDGIILLVMFGLFLYYVYKQVKKDPEKQDIHVKQYSAIKIWGLILGGLAGLVIGGRFVVINASLLAEALGMSEKIIGLTIVAAGTSLPELATSVVAAFKKNSDIAVGNIIGSNIFNIFLIIGVSSLINPLAYNSAFNLEILLLTLGTLILFITMFTGKKKKLDRWEAVILLLIFVFYTYYIISREG
ncbi:MAG: calcium/sodium antiporter [Bacteroidales bacterium]|nr:calcium/sodium antiporter [Bacteroidales bacterium]